MKENNLPERKELAVQLLLELKKICVQIRELADKLAGSSESYMDQVIVECGGEIKALTEEYNSNIRRVEEITNRMTSRMNDWFAFAKNDENRMKLFFPFRYYAKKNKLRKFLKQSREQISETVIQNRFVKGELNSLEEKLRCKAILKMEQGEEYETFKELNETKKDILEALSYLLPTLPDIGPVHFSAEDTDSLVMRISKA